MIKIGGHRGSGCTDHEFYAFRDIDNIPTENSRESVAMAFANGADYIEFDVVSSADNILFALHNVVPTDHFFTDPIPTEPLNNMSFLDIGRHRVGRKPDTEIATLTNILDCVAQYDPMTINWAVNIEIKGVQGSGQNWDGQRFIDEIADIVKKSFFPESRILWSSFCLENVIRMSHHFPHSHYGLLYTEPKSTGPIYKDHIDDVRFQNMPFEESYVLAANDCWKKDANPATALKYAHPEITTVSEHTIQMAAKYDLGLNSWGLFEKMDENVKKYYGIIQQMAEQHNVPYTAITDYIEELKSVGAQSSTA